MKPFYRRRFLVHSFQYRLVLFQAGYFALLGGTTYFCGVAPLLEAIGDGGLPADQRVGSAETLLFFDRHVLPFVGPMILVVFAHSVLVSHRIAGPIYRFAAVLRSIAAGDLSIGVRIRHRDYLQEEAHVLEEAVIGLRRRIAALRTRALAIGEALDRLGPCVPEGSTKAWQEARAATSQLADGLDEFVLERRGSSGRAGPKAHPMEAA